jgi:hypothetical protein
MYSYGTSKSMDANKLIAEMENKKEHVLIYGTSKRCDSASKLIAEMENEKEHVLIYGASKRCDRFPPRLINKWRG